MRIIFPGRVSDSLFLRPIAMDSVRLVTGSVNGAPSILEMKDILPSKSFVIIMAVICISIRRSVWPEFPLPGRDIISVSVHRGIRSDRFSSSLTGLHRIFRRFRELRWMAFTVPQRRNPCGCSRGYSDCRQAESSIILPGMRFQIFMWESAGLRNRFNKNGAGAEIISQAPVFTLSVNCIKSPLEAWYKI